MTLWDSQWYGGHWLPDYSVAVPALAAAVSVPVLTVVAAVVATACFERLVTRGFAGAAARASALVFAAGVAVPVAIGQLTFLTGEAAGLACVVALAARRWWLASTLGVVTSLCSPLDGAFACLAAGALAVSELLAHLPPVARSRIGTLRHVGLAPSVVGPAVVAAATATPVLVLAVAFPGEGAMPFPGLDWAWELAVAALAWLAAGGRPVLRTGIALYALALCGSELLASPLGGNIGRLEDVVAVPLAASLLWGRRLVAAAAAVPLVLSQWSPAWAAITSLPADRSTHRAYYDPLVRWLAAAGGPAGRVEVVPTAAHYEAVYVAPEVALARGWERQLDVADDPIFYRPGALDAASYRAWLLANGVRFVALASAPLDGAGRSEGRLVSEGVTGLTPVWSDADWRVWRVDGSTGLTGAGARVVSASGATVRLEVDRSGPVLVRERWSPAWRVTSGRGSLSRAPGGWLSLRGGPGPVTLTVGWPP